MNPQIRSIAELYRFDTRLVDLALTDLSNEDATRRWRRGEGSSISYLVGHMLSSRVGLLKRFGAAEENPWAERFGAEAGGARDGDAYPPIGELIAAWQEVGARLETTLANLDDEQLAAPAEGFPIEDQTARGAVHFIAWHEIYHVGQIGQMRTEMGYASTKDRLYEARAATA